MSSLRTVKTIGNLSRWQVSNLPLQKLLYLSHMMYLGETGVPLVSRPFEAWDLGPVEPYVYHLFKAYGSKPVVDIVADEPYQLGDAEFDAISGVMAAVGQASPGRLVAITHWDEGAWAINYVPGVKGIVIPDADILDEYRRRLATSAAAAVGNGGTGGNAQAAGPAEAV